MVVLVCVFVSHFSCFLFDQIQCLFSLELHLFFFFIICHHVNLSHPFTLLFLCFFLPLWTGSVAFLEIGRTGGDASSMPGEKQVGLQNEHFLTYLSVFFLFFFFLLNFVCLLAPFVFFWWIISSPDSSFYLFGIMENLILICHCYFFFCFYLFLVYFCRVEQVTCVCQGCVKTGSACLFVWERRACVSGVFVVAEVTFPPHSFGCWHSTGNLQQCTVLHSHIPSPVKWAPSYSMWLSLC